MIFAKEALYSRMLRIKFLDVWLAFFCLLCSWGSLRASISAIGYWVLWLVWSVGGGVYVKLLRQRREPLLFPPVSIVLAFLLLIAGIFISGFYNSDMKTIYQSIKILVIFSIYVVFWLLYSKYSYVKLVWVVLCVLVISGLVFFCSKWIYPFDYVFGDGREGFFFSHVGDLWKTGTLFLPLVFGAFLTSRQISRVLISAAVGICVFFTIVDGSRAGLLLTIGILFSIFLILVFDRNSILIKKFLIINLSAAGFVVAFMVINNSMYDFKSDALCARADESTVATCLEVYGGKGVFGHVTNNRLGLGDSSRIKLLENALHKVPNCWSTGCGYGSTLYDSGLGVPLHVHNAYLGVLVDFGFLGGLGLLLFFITAVLPIKELFKSDTTLTVRYRVLALSGAGVAYCAAFMVYPYTSEMSDWGFFIMTLVFSWGMVGHEHDFYSRAEKLHV